LWEKEIRRARKESFKSQSVLVKLQEELKAARNSMKTAQVELEQEKQRSMKREQEAFAARYQLVGVQEELSQVQEQIKLVEQERDALRTIAKNEEIARNLRRQRRLGSLWIFSPLHRLRRVRKSWMIFA
jgi:vacuolar-type H+-ATPase subunit I/STV1